jgi:hypothetical protein
MNFLTASVLPGTGKNWKKTAVFAGCFAMVWLVSRAVKQAITIDEADSYLSFVDPDWPSQWYPSNANHVLNSILTRLLTWFFGLSHLTVRGPALIGAAIYIVAAYRLCEMIAESSQLFLPLFVCFVYNPFVMDYLVAARGYGLALGFLTLGFSILAQQTIAAKERSYRSTMAASICLALSFNANFSFAYVDAFSMVVYFAWMCWSDLKRISARFVAACLLPGLLVTLIISGSVLSNWPKGQFVFGAQSLKEMRQEVVSASFYELNQNLVNPLLFRALSWASRFAPIWVLILASIESVVMALYASRRKQLLQLLGLAMVTLTLTLTFHWLQFRIFHILLPKDRTALFLVPLTLVSFASLTAMMPPSRLGQALRVLGISTFYFFACYFVGSLRLTYFNEWRFDADVKSAYLNIRALNQNHGSRKFASSWMYVGCLNFYRHYFHDEKVLDVFDTANLDIPGEDGYVLYGPDGREFIHKQKLMLVYTGGLSDIVVAVPASEPPP